MQTAKQFSIIGGGGFGMEVAGYLCDIHQGRNIRLNLWDDLAPEGTKHPTLNYRGAISDIALQKDETALICVGDCNKRANIAILLREKGIELGKLIHPSAVVSSQASIAPGCIILPFSCISFSAELGWNTVINSHVGVGHHAVVGDHCMISPQSLIAGGAEIGDRVFMGSGVVVTPAKSIGHNSKIAAGSVIYRNYANEAFITGNPSRNHT